jgi:hypothetical protein
LARLRQEEQFDGDEYVYDAAPLGEGPYSTWRCRPPCLAAGLDLTCNSPSFD